MSSHYFGFDDEEAVEDMDTSTSRIANKDGAIQMKKPSSPTKLPISEIQALLTQDLINCDSTLNSTLNESSFYADEDTSVCQSRLDLTMDETFSVSEVESPRNSSITINGKTRKIIKGERRARKVLGSIENKGNEDVKTPVRSYKKTASRSTGKNKENQKPKKAKLSKKNIADENYNKLAEEIQKKFDEIEKFQLAVE